MGCVVCSRAEVGSHRCRYLKTKVCTLDGSRWMARPWQVQSTVSASDADQSFFLRTYVRRAPVLYAFRMGTASFPVTAMPLMYNIAREHGINGELRSVGTVDMRTVVAL